MRRNSHTDPHGEMLARIVELERQAEEGRRFRALFDNSPEAILYSTYDGTILDCNPAACDLYGYDREALVGRTIRDLMTPDVADRFPETLRLERNGDGLVTIDTNVGAAGAPFPVETITRLVEIDGHMFRWTVVHNLAERTDERRSPIITDDRVREMTSFLPDLIGEPDFVIETDAAGSIVSATRSFFAHTGIPESALAGGIAFDRLRGEEDGDAPQIDLKQLSRADHHEVIETRMRKADGEEFPALVTCLPLHRSDDRATLRMFVIDLTRHKAIEQNIVTLEKIHTLGEMSGGIVHDINNLLAVILGYIELMSEQTGSGATCARCREMLGSIQNTAEDGAKILARIRSFSRYDHEEAPERIDVNGMVNGTVDLLKPALASMKRDKTIAVRIETGDVLPVQGSEAELREVLNNLILNAVDAIESEGSITIRTGHDGSHATISVTDTGSGMTEEVRGSLFKPFFTTKGGAGTGLGLYISRNLLRRYGGDIMVSSAPGEGSTFTIILAPIRETEASPPPSSKTAPAVAVTSDTVSAEPLPDEVARNILIVDDEPNICSLLNEFLARHNLPSTITTTVAEAIAALNDTPYDLVITDLNLPDGTGLDIARHAKHTHPGCTVVLISGSCDNLVQTARDNGVIDHTLPKPIDLFHLASIARARRSFVSGRDE